MLGIAVIFGKPNFTMKKILTLTFVLFFGQWLIAQSTTPTAQLGDLQDEGPWPRSSVLIQEILNVNADVKYEVVSFKLDIKDKNGQSEIAFAQGNTLTPEMETKLNKIEEGYTVTFEKIIAKEVNGEGTLLLAPVSYKITDKHINPTIEKIDDGAISMGNIDFKSDYTLDELKKQKEIKVISSSGISYKVVSFNVIVVPKVASPMMATFMGDTITEAGLTMVSELESETSSLLSEW